MHAYLRRHSGFGSQRDFSFGRYLCLCEGDHLRVADALKCVDMISWGLSEAGHGEAFAPARRLCPYPAACAGQREGLGGSRNSKPLGERLIAVVTPTLSRLN